jgi:serine/threonine protein kinase
MSFQVGEDLGDYKVAAIIGRDVYQVEHYLTRRKEAAKVLSTELATAVQIQRFEREIALQAQLDHPNIATLHTAFRWKGSLVLVMEFLEGPTLEQLLAERRVPQGGISQGHISIETGVGYIRQALAALGYAHAHGVVHRDVTPGNLIVTAHGVKLTDFGVSKSFGDVQLTNCGDIVGNLDYMAPEQARGSAQPDRRSDLYAVGAILYEILTGVKPFGEGRKFGPLVMDAETEPRPPAELSPALAPEWNAVVSKALMRDRERRYASAAEFLAAMDQVALARPAASLAEVVKRWRFRIAGASIAAAVAVLPVLVNKGGFSQTPPAPIIRFHIPAPQLAAPEPVIAADPLPSDPAPAPAPALAPVPAPRISAHRREAAPFETPAEAPLTEPTPPKPEVAFRPPAKPDEAAASAPASPAVMQPQTAASVEPEPSAATPSDSKENKKVGFWGKLNPFKKKSTSTQ